MEALLHHLTDYGIAELSFIIVNSKASHSQAMIHKLKDSVSFPVYQETDEEEVWKIMEGGKDDMFVYDKCGRLTYYIPFPLSIIHEDQPIVQAAVLSTYFQSPCGIECSGNSTFTNNALDEEIPEEAIQHSNGTNEHINIEDDFAMVTTSNSTTVDLEETTPKNDVEYYEIYENFTMNDNETHIPVNNFTDTEEPSSRSNSTMEPMKEYRGLLSSLMNLIFGGHKKYADEDDDTLDKTNGDIGGTSAINDDVDDTSSKAMSSANDSATSEEQPPSPKDHTKPCVAFDDKVCRDWSKRRLLQAQRCCASLTEHAISFDKMTEHDHQHHRHRSCKNYGKKRCTKMQPLFKCCLKTKMELTIDEASDERKEEEKKM